MTRKIEPQPKIMDIELYVGGKGHLEGIENVVKLSSNENPHGPSPAAKAAFLKEADFLSVYPSSDHGALRNAIADAHGFEASRLICTNGSDELISLICQAFAGVEDEVVFTEHGFLLYRVCALGAGATPIEVPEDNRKTDVDAILGACTDKTKIVFIANPNNPTGTMIDGDEVMRLAEGLPPQALLVLDAAYAEFVDGFDGGASIVDACKNVVMTRTFSKIYGLGAMRLGWGYAPQNIIDILSRMRGPFNVNSGALAAGLAAVQDTKYLEWCRAENAKQRDWLTAALRDIGLGVDDSHTNFILVRFDNEQIADAADKVLQQNGILIREVKGYGLPNCLRITIGEAGDCERIAAILITFLKAENS